MKRKCTAPSSAETDLHGIQHSKSPFKVQYKPLGVIDSQKHRISE